MVTAGSGKFPLQSIWLKSTISFVNSDDAITAAISQFLFDESSISSSVVPNSIDSLESISPINVSLFSSATSLSSSESFNLHVFVNRFQTNLIDSLESVSGVSSVLMIPSLSITTQENMSGSRTSSFVNVQSVIDDDGQSTFDQAFVVHCQSIDSAESHSTLSLRCDSLSSSIVESTQFNDVIISLNVVEIDSIESTTSLLNSRIHNIVAPLPVDSLETVEIATIVVDQLVVVESIITSESVDSSDVNVNVGVIGIVALDSLSTSSMQSNISCESIASTETIGTASMISMFKLNVESLETNESIGLAGLRLSVNSSITTIDELMSTSVTRTLINAGNVQTNEIVETCQIKPEKKIEPQSLVPSTSFGSIAMRMITSVDDGISSFEQFGTVTLQNKTFDEPPELVKKDREKLRSNIRGSSSSSASASPAPLTERTLVVGVRLIERNLKKIDDEMTTVKNVASKSNRAIVSFVKSNKKSTTVNVTYVRSRKHARR